jgi:hypothetical protein
MLGNSTTMAQEILSNHLLLLGAGFRHKADENRSLGETATLLSGVIPLEGFVIVIILGI